MKISVVDENNAPVGEATTSATGDWAIPVPKAGMYKVTLDVNTLPQGVSLRNPDRATLTVQVFEGNERNVLFALVSGDAADEEAAAAEAEDSWWTRLAQLSFEGISLGLTIALGAVGLSLIFGTTGLTNFAHGELLTLGAFTAYVLNTSLGLHLLIAAPLALVIAAAFGYGQDRYFWGVLRERKTGLIGMMIISIGLAIFLRNLTLFLFGGESRPYNEYVAQEGIEIGPIFATPKGLIAMAIQIVVLIAVGLALTYTRLGKATRAVADNPALAASSGINVDRVIRIVWAAGTTIAALAGILLGTTQNLNYQMGLQVLLLMFAGVTLGGLGTAYGALVGSLIVGLFVQVSTLWIPPEMKTVGALVVLIIVLLVRPQGILGRRERIG
ncbi:branched-chain amino acid transport system permease protein [Thermocatellispora tengchongensis]|uniref:Branched-chain amino acid transport system permease protein n=1 Tax=Thermocatellispora tengchongensis TaxID=1073253 RepID=A0A840NX56_9ACTN|nr:branched-chain amino acid ABC transporter permease [Thermocatellispora tengchongensis]MBB5131792.1 branched-chain amino acid transport system permease protein [Thermocatellispora tengchongensis]